jgi:putative acetyltransferase
MVQPIDLPTSLLLNLQSPYRTSQPFQRRPPVLLRDAVPRDAVAIWHVLRAAVTTLIERPYTRAQVEAWIADESPDNLLNNPAPGRTTFVAESDQRIIGFTRLCGTEVEALYVHPAQAGRKVGEALLMALEGSASERNVKTLYLDAALNAVPFYQSAGYRKLGPSFPAFDNGVTLPCVRMIKTLRGPEVRWCRPRTQPLLSGTSSAAFSRRML